jgi:FAD/FMN-containing dehydrogenase
LALRRLSRGRIDLPKLFIGSEATLGVFSEATIRLVDKPHATLTALIHFKRLEDVGEAVPQLLQLGPSALEVMDANTLDLIGRSRTGSRPTRLPRYWPNSMPMI